MQPNEEKRLLNLIILPIQLRDGETKSGMDATVMDWIYHNEKKDVSAPVATSMGGDFDDRPLTTSKLAEMSEYYSQEGGASGGGMSDENKQQLAQLAVKGTALLFQKMSQRKQDEYRQEIKGRCGRKPVIGKKKRAKYFQCVAEFNKQVADREKIANIPAPPPSPPKKAINPLFIVGGIVGVGALGFLAYKLIKAKKG